MSAWNRKDGLALLVLAIAALLFLLFLATGLLVLLQHYEETCVRTASRAPDK